MDAREFLRNFPDWRDLTNVSPEDVGLTEEDLILEESWEEIEAQKREEEEREAEEAYHQEVERLQAQIPGMTEFFINYTRKLPRFISDRELGHWTFDTTWKRFQRYVNSWEKKAPGFLVRWSKCRFDSTREEYALFTGIVVE